jgi:hypothetical protein
MTAPDQTLERTPKTFASDHGALQPAPRVVGSFGFMRKVIVKCWVAQFFFVRPGAHGAAWN